MRRIQGFALGAMVLGFVLGASTKADAAFIAYVCSTQFCTGGTDLIVTDNGTGDLANTTAGAIGILGSVAGFDFVVDVSQSKPLIGSAALPQMDITYTLTNAFGTAGTIWLYASDTNFTGTVNLQGTLDGNSSASAFTINGGVWGGTSNTAVLSNQLITFGPLTQATSTCANGSCSYTDSGSAGPVGGIVNPYALVIGLSLFSNSLGTTTGDLLLTSVPVPEPTSLALLGVALLGGGAAVRRRRRRNAA